MNSTQRQNLGLLSNSRVRRFSRDNKPNIPNPLIPTAFAETIFCIFAKTNDHQDSDTNTATTPTPVVQQTIQTMPTIPTMPPLEQESQQTIQRQSYTKGANSQRYQLNNNTACAVSKDVMASCSNIISHFHLGGKNQTQYTNYNGNNNSNSDKASSNGLLAQTVDGNNGYGVNTCSHRDEEKSQLIFVGDIDFTHTS